MRYMLLVYLNEQTLSESERQECYVKSARLAQDIHSSGKYLDAAPLHPTSTATSIPYATVNGSSLTDRSQKRVNNSAAIT